MKIDLLFKISRTIYKLYFKCIVFSLVSSLFKNTLIPDGELSDVMIGLPLIVIFILSPIGIIAAILHLIKDFQKPVVIQLWGHIIAFLVFAIFIFVFIHDLNNIPLVK